MEERLENYIRKFIQLNINNETKLIYVTKKLDKQFDGRMVEFDRRLKMLVEEVAEQ